MTRSEALALGLVRYDTGEPCRRGHLTYRYVKCGHCAECWRLKRERYRARMKAAGIPTNRSRPKALPKPRAAAKAAGAVTYFGKPCKHGHPGERYVTSATCLACSRACSRLTCEKALRGGRRRSEADRGVTEVQREKRRQKARRYRLLKKASGKHTSSDVRWLLKQQKGNCGICLEPLGKLAWEVDHRIAVILGGSNERSNLQIAHAKCNRSRGKRHEIDYAQQTFGRLL